jgi:uncharacterized protein (DUF2164 family)
MPFSNDYEDKVNELSKAARYLSERSDLRVAIVRDADLIDQFKKEQGPHWFNETSHNSIVMFREKPERIGRQRFYDLETDQYAIQPWISYSSLDEVEKLTETTAKILQSLEMPFFLAFVPKDFENDEASMLLMNNLQSAAWSYPQMMFLYTDEQREYQIREHMTIIWDDLPSLGLLNHEGMVPCNFPRNQPFTKANLKTFFNSFINGTLHTAKFSLPDANLDFGLNLPHSLRVDLVRFLN